MFSEEDIEKFFNRIGYEPLQPIEDRRLPSGNRWFKRKMCNRFFKLNIAYIAIYVFSGSYPKIPREDIESLISISKADHEDISAPIILKVLKESGHNESDLYTVVEKNCFTDLNRDITGQARRDSDIPDFNAMYRYFNSIIDSRKINFNKYKNKIVELHQIITELETKILNMENSSCRE